MLNNSKISGDFNVNKKVDIWQAGTSPSTVLSSWHRQWHWHGKDLDTIWLQLELLHHRPVPLYFGTYFSHPAISEDIWHRDWAGSERVRGQDWQVQGDQDIIQSREQKPDVMDPGRGHGQSDVSKWWVFKTQKVSRIFSKIWARGRLLLYLSHKEKFRWNQTKTRYRGGRHVPGHIWYPGGLKRTAAENLFPFVRFTSEFMGF